MNNTMFLVAKYAGAVFLFVATYWTVLFFTQRRLMFPAPLVSHDNDARPRDAKQLWFDGAGYPTEAWLLPATSHNESALMIFAHGNGEVIDDWFDAFDQPRRWGVSVLLVEYPGYGRSKGKPSETSIRAIFREAFDWAVQQESLDPNRVIGYGRSLGGGAIAGLSRERPLAAMILESSFTSTKPFALRFGAPSFLVRDPFDNEVAVRLYQGHLLVLHGSDDDMIPIEHGRALARAGGVVLHEMPCGHNDCGRSWPRIREFLIESQVISADQP